MSKHPVLGYLLAGTAAGTVAGLLGAGGGMVLVPLLTWLTDIPEDCLFPTSLSIMLPVCMVSIAVTAMAAPVPWGDSLPYLLGSAAGGILAGRWGKKIPVKWLHKGLGILILWGGFRFLC